MLLWTYNYLVQEASVAHGIKLHQNAAVVVNRLSTLHVAMFEYQDMQRTFILR